MLISIRSRVPVLVAGTFVGCLLNRPLANAAKLAPALEKLCHSGGHHHLPKFGLSSRTVYGVGEQVVRVRCQGLVPSSFICSGIRNV